MKTKLAELEALFKERSGIMQNQDKETQARAIPDINQRIVTTIGDAVTLHCLLVGHMEKLLKNYDFSKEE